MKIQPRAQVWLFFLSVYLLTATLCAPILASGEGISKPINKVLMGVTTFLPSLLGILFMHLTKSPGEIRGFWRRVIRLPRGRSRMVVAGLVILPVLTLTAFVIASLMDGVPLSMEYARALITDWKILLVFLGVEFFLGAVSEELGWRGYALPELQKRWNALTSSLVLGVIWAFWHTPAFLIPGLSQYEMGGVFSWKYLAFLALPISGSILHTWIYNSTNGSILVAGILMHFVQNATMILLGGIFDGFNPPSSFWVVAPILTAITAGWIVLRNGPKTLQRGNSGITNSTD